MAMFRTRDQISAVLVIFLGLPVAHQVSAQTSLNVVPGWNLLGNSTASTLSVAAYFGDADKVTSVWKWVPAKSAWAFYSPATSDGGAAYAASKSYDVMASINSAEGFWVNAKTGFSTQFPGGAAVSSTSFQTALVTGWNLIATGDSKTPSQFNLALSSSAPTTGSVPTNFTTLWAWDATLANWYFYAPSMDADGTTTLSSYIASNRYLNFVSATLTPQTGFWVNKPETTTTPPSTPVIRSGPATAGDWLTFTLNVQDFAYPDRSAATVDRVITLHEQYKVPVDIYLTDNALATFESGYTALMTRLQASPYVALNYHIRPPKPYDHGYDWAGLTSMSASDQVSRVLNYESHVTDLITGQPGSSTGGFKRLKEITGSHPVIAAFQPDARLSKFDCFQPIAVSSFWI